jgi:predicted amidohydrolase YtcJ
MQSFVDGHAHPLFAGREALGPRLEGLKSVAEIKKQVAQFANENPDREWIVGGAYDRSLATSFMASWIDDVCEDRPVVLHASDHHTIWVNSKALALAGLSETAREISIGIIDTDENGKPTGTLRESGAMELVLDLIPPNSMELELKALDWAHQEMLSYGITAVQDAWIEKGMTEVYLEAHRQNRLKVRTNLAFRVTPENWETDFEYIQQMRHEVNALSSPLLTAKTVKFFADGVLGSATAAVLEPYDSTQNHGEPVWSEAILKTAVKKYADLDFQLHIHAIGDAGVRMALDAIESAAPNVGPSVIAHTELVHPNDIPRFKQLNVIANFEPLWARKDGMLTSCTPHIGTARIDQMYQMRSFLNSGATIAFGSDWPVSSVSPVLGIFTAVNRAVPGGPSWTIHEALTTQEAVDAYTTTSRVQILDDFKGDEKVVLDKNPFETEASELHNIKVLEVWRDGILIWPNDI